MKLTGGAWTQHQALLKPLSQDQGRPEAVVGPQREGAQQAGTLGWAAVCKQQPDGCWQKTSQSLGNSSVFKLMGEGEVKGSSLAQIWVKLNFHQPVLKEQL